MMCTIIHYFASEKLSKEEWSLVRFFKEESRAEEREESLVLDFSDSSRVIREEI